VAIGKYLNITHSSGIPVYRQVMEQIKKAVATGDILADEKLPTIRELSGILKINPNTIAKVYNELERENIIYKRQGMGTFVSPQVKRSETLKVRRAEALKAATHFLLETWSLQLSHEELKDILQESADNLNLDQKWKKPKKQGMDNE
jgi:GntR family transcriptional regulator